MCAFNCDQEELTTALRDYVGRETPLYFAGRLTEHYKSISRTTGDGPEIYLKREDLTIAGPIKSTMLSLKR